MLSTVKRDVLGENRNELSLCDSFLGSNKPCSEFMELIDDTLLKHKISRLATKIGVKDEVKEKLILMGGDSSEGGKRKELALGILEQYLNDFDSSPDIIREDDNINVDLDNKLLELISNDESLLPDITQLVYFIKEAGEKRISESQVKELTKLVIKFSRLNVDGSFPPFFLKDKVKVSLAYNSWKAVSTGFINSLNTKLSANSLKNIEELFVKLTNDELDVMLFRVIIPGLISAAQSIIRYGLVPTQSIAGEGGVSSEVVESNAIVNPANSFITQEKAKLGNNLFKSTDYKNYHEKIATNQEIAGEFQYIDEITKQLIDLGFDNGRGKDDKNVYGAGALHYMDKTELLDLQNLVQSESYVSVSSSHFIALACILNKKLIKLNQHLLGIDNFEPFPILEHSYINTLNSENLGGIQEWVKNIRAHFQTKCIMPPQNWTSS